MIFFRVGGAEGIYGSPFSAGIHVLSTAKPRSKTCIIWCKIFHLGLDTDVSVPQCTSVFLSSHLNIR